jgi:hypothetical protein
MQIVRDSYTACQTHDRELLERSIADGTSIEDPRV